MHNCLFSSPRPTLKNGLCLLMRLPEECPSCPSFVFCRLRLRPLYRKHTRYLLQCFLILSLISLSPVFVVFYYLFCRGLQRRERLTRDNNMLSLLFHSGISCCLLSVFLSVLNLSFSNFLLAFTYFVGVSSIAGDTEAKCRR